MDFVIRNARLRGRTGRFDIGLEGGRVARIENHLSVGGARELDAAGNLVTPGFTNVHCHLDKCLTGAWAEIGSDVNSGSPDVIPVAKELKKRFREDEMVKRASEAVRTSVVAGTTAIRAFADVDTTGGLMAVKSLLKVKQQFRDAIEMQVVAFAQEGILRDPGTEELLHKSMDMGADVVGGIPWYERTPRESRRHTDIVFQIAKRYNRDIHMLVDDTSDAKAKNIEYLLSKTVREGFQGRVAASHCRGALDSPDESYANRIIELAREAGATIVENSHVSLMMYGRTDGHPVRRGVTRVKEFLRAGVNVAIGQDDIDDPYYPFGRGDMLELAWMMAHAAHLSSRQEIEMLYDMITLNGARAMRLKDYGVGIGNTADLVVLEAEDVHSALRLQAGRNSVLKRGRLVAESRTQRKLFF